MIFGKKKFTLYQKTQLATLFIYGNNAENFLQGQASCNITDLSAQEIKLGSFSDNKGKCYATFFLKKVNKHRFKLILNVNIVDKVIQELRKYSIFYPDLKITYFNDLMGEQLVCFKEDFEIDKTNEPYVIHLVSKLYLIENSFINQLIDNTGFRLDIEEGDSYKKYLFKTGICLLQKKASKLYTPNQIFIGQKQGIDFDKGCFTGQEIIARIYYRGLLKKVMFFAEIDEKKLNNISINQIQLSNENNNKLTILDHCFYANKLYLIALGEKANKMNLITDKKSSSSLKLTFKIFE